MIEIRLGDCFEILPTLPDQSFDAVIIDPPYGINLDPRWDQPVDIARVTAEAKRLGREFYAFFGQMPTIADWHHAAVAQGLKFLEHITWIKRTSTMSNRLMRTHEEIYIYALGSRCEFYTTDGRYEDVKVSGLSVDLVSLEGFRRQMAELHYIIKHGKERKISPGRCLPQYDRFSNVDKRPTREYCNFSNAWSFLPESQKTFNHGGKFHPTMKPVLLCERLVELLTPSGGRVLDCFSGSGTTAIACLHTGRECLCIERDPDYWRLSNDRLQNDHFQRELTFDAPEDEADDYAELPN